MSDRLRARCRQLGYQGAEFNLQMIDLRPDFQLQYSRAAAMWQLLDVILRKKEVFALQLSEKTGKFKRLSTIFWGAHQRFFKNMLMAAKVPALADEARAAIESNHSVVIGLQSTGEANQKAVADEEGARPPRRVWVHLLLRPRLNHAAV